MDRLVVRVRALWAEVAGADLPERGLRVVCVPGSRMCPPGWVGTVWIDDALLVTAPTPALAARLGSALAGLPLDHAQLALSGAPAGAPAGALSGAPAGAPAGRAQPVGVTAPGGRAGSARGDSPEDGLVVRDLLGPAHLAYLEGADFTGAAVEERAAPAALGELFEAAGPDEVDESGLDGIPVPSVAVVREGGRIVAAAGYHPWPTDAAHVCVLTAAHARGRGLATRVAAAATADALDAGRLPQWRARVPGSRRVAAKLGYRTLGRQLSAHLTLPD